MAGRVVGRDAELASLARFVSSIPHGTAALVLEGEAGVGKTTIWGAGLELAADSGLRVLEARPAESETALSFTGIGDLLDPVLDEALEALPAPQRRVLSRALVLSDEDGPDPDPHAIGVAVLGAVRSLTTAAPLLCAVDDVQWLDAASAAALAYAVRRLRGERVGVLLARRATVDSSLLTELRRTFPSERLHEVEVGPLDLRSLHRVVQDHLDVTLPRPLLAEVHAAAGGNPFFALELVRTLQRRGTSVEAGQPLPVPESLRELVHARLEALPPESRVYLLGAAAQAQPTTSLVEAATGVTTDLGLRRGLDAGIVELDGDRIRFSHPLLAAGAYETADSLRRAEVHARLAELVDDLEARGRHLAASVTAPDEDVAAALAEAAATARARGAPRAAALLLDRAYELTPASRADDASRRAIDAAYLHYESGDSPRAEAQLRSVVERLPRGPMRARALMRLGRVQSYERQHDAAGLFLQAIEEAGGDTEILAVAHEGVSACLFRLRERLQEAVEHAELAARLALELGHDNMAAEAYGSQLLAETLLGRESAVETLDRALELQAAAEHSRVLGQPLVAASVYWWWTDRFDEARAAELELLRRGYELGDESSAPYVLVLLGQVELALGRLDEAMARAEEGWELARQSGQPTIVAYHLALKGLVEAQRGQSELASEHAAHALELAPATGGRPAELLARWALGHVRLSAGDPGAAIVELAPSIDFVRREAMGEPAAMRFVTDFVEALLEVGREDEAHELLDWYEGHARRLERTSALASCARCRGLLAAAAGQIDDALAALEEALLWHGRVDLPLDHGRTLLALGATQRRAKRRKEARATLDEAVAVFERLGAGIWAERARAELRRISGRAPTAGALTPAEERVAALVAEGKTNREVASALYLSDRTVEGHLSRIFGKLGIRHRRELAAALEGVQTQVDTPSNTGDPPVSTGSLAP